MNNDKFVWLAVEPYVHGVVKKNDVLLYNTMGKMYLIYRGNSEIAGMVKQLLDPQNGYVIKINRRDLNKPSVHRLVSDLRKKYMGDVHEPQWTQSKPFNIVPVPVIKQGVKGLENNLNEITFHLNTSGHADLEPFKEACYQFPFPMYAADPGKTLSLDVIQSVAGQVASLPFATINFVGSGIFGEPLFSQLVNIFKETPFKRKFHVPLSQLIFPTGNKLGRHDHLCVYITFPLDQVQLDILQSVSITYAKNPRLECNFVVRDIAEVEQATELIARMAFRNTFFKPYMNGSNMQFFRENVFISEEDIRASRPTQNQVFSRLSMNENDYGKLTVLPGGDVYANLNDDLLGNLNHHSVADLVEKEVATGKSWKRRRTVVEPCKNCLYQFLCPPVSNYEIRLKRFNFCHIYPE